MVRKTKEIGVDQEKWTDESCAPETWAEDLI